MSMPENSLMAASTSSWMTPGFVKSPGTPTASPPRPLISSQIESHTLLRGERKSRASAKRVSLAVSVGIPRVRARAKRGRDSPVQVVENESGSVLSEENGGLPPDAPPGPGDDGNASLEQSGRGSASSAREVSLHNRYSSPVRHRCRCVVVVALFVGFEKCAPDLPPKKADDCPQRFPSDFSQNAGLIREHQPWPGGVGFPRLQAPRRGARGERGSLLGKARLVSSLPLGFSYPVSVPKGGNETRGTS